MQVKQVTSTLLPAQNNEADYPEWPSLSTQTHNFRKAFAITGPLIANGYVPVDLNASGWKNQFEALVLDVAQVLNTLAA